MKKSKQKKYIEEVLAHYRELNNCFDHLSSLTGVKIDSRTGNAIWKTFDALVNNTSKLIGDKSESLNWFIHDNDCGRNGLEAGTFYESFPVKTVNDLIDLIKLEQQT